MEAKQRTPPTQTQIILAHFQPKSKSYDQLLASSGGRIGPVTAAGKSSVRCPYCGALASTRWGCYKRFVEWFGGALRVRVQRYRCGRCGKTYSRLPSLCVPRYRYGAPVIGWVLEHYYRDGLGWERLLTAVRAAWPQVSVALTTLRRWVKRFGDVAASALTVATRALARLEPEASVLAKKEAVAATPRAQGAVLLTTLEALRKASEGSALGRGYSERRFEFYNLWLYRQRGTPLLG